MKGTTITAMVLAAAAASAATIVALKKAHDRKRLEAELHDDWGYDAEDEFEAADADETDDEANTATEDTKDTEDANSVAAKTECCKDGVCSLDLGDDDAAADQPVQLHMPDEAITDKKEKA